MAGKDVATSLVVWSLVIQYLVVFVSATVQERGQEGLPEIETIVRRVEQTRRSDGGSTPGSTGKVVVDKTETSVKTDHQVVEPNGETTHLEQENVETVEKTKPADDPVGGAPADDPVGAAPADDPVGGAPADDPVGGAPADDPVGGAPAGDLTQSNAADPPPPQSDSVNAALRSEDNIDGPVAHDGEILLEDWQFILIVCGCVAVGVLGIAVAFLCWYK